MSENQADKIEPDCLFPSDTKDKWEVVSEVGQKLLSPASTAHRKRRCSKANIYVTFTCGGRW